MYPSLLPEILIRNLTAQEIYPVILFRVHLVMGLPLQAQETMENFRGHGTIQALPKAVGKVPTNSQVLCNL